MKKKQQELEQKRIQANLRGGAGASAAVEQASVGVASLRIKAKDGGKDGGKGKKANNMFGDIDAAAATTTTGDEPEDNIPRVNPLTTDYELITQTTFSGDLYKTARQIHLFVPDVAPNKSYFLIPSTSVPGQESAFQLQVFGASIDAELKFEPCHLNNKEDGTAGDMSGLASRRVTAASSAGLASHKIKKTHEDGAKGTPAKPKHKAEKHR